MFITAGRGLRIEAVVPLTHCSYLWAIKRFCKRAWKQVSISQLALTCEDVRARPAVYVLVRVWRPAVLGSVGSFLILCILNQDHTSHLSDDKCSFGHFCQQAQLQSWENKDSSKSLFWLCSSSAALPSLYHLSLVFHLISPSDVPCLSFFSPQMWARHRPLFPSVSLHLSPSLFPPPRRLAQSLLRVRKQTQIILGALLACDRGLTSRFEWEHMEIIMANWHMHELACPPGKMNGRCTNSRLTQLTASRKHTSKGELVDRDTARLILMMLWHAVCCIWWSDCVIHMLVNTHV